MAKLIAVRGPTKGRQYPLRDICYLGRSPNCQVYVGDLTVSREHAVVKRVDDDYIVEDLSSGNGTYVNEARVETSTLSDSDEIRISNSVFRYVKRPVPQTKWVSMVTVDSSWDPEKYTFRDSRPSLPALAALESEVDLRSDLARAHRMLKTFYAVSAATSSILDPTTLFNKILDALFAIFTSAERGFILLKDEQDQLVPRVIRRRKGAGHQGGLSISQSIVNRVMEEGVSVITAANESDRDSPNSTDGEEPRAEPSRMCAPLIVRGETLGLLHIEGRVGDPPFSQEDLDLLSGVAHQAAVVIHNASLHQRLMTRQRLERDLRLARQVQQSFLPSELPQVPGYAFNHEYAPLYEVGGDFYDFLRLPSGKLAVLIGDISGKGISAALLMARLTSELRYYAISESDPSRVLARANEFLLKNAHDNMFATAIYLVLDPATHRITIANAGHIPAQLWRAAKGCVEPLDDSTNMALGVLTETQYDQSVLELNPGDRLLLSTDGVIEATNQEHEEFGQQRLRDIMGQSEATDLCGEVLREVRHFTGEMSSNIDDITLVSLARQK